MTDRVKGYVVTLDDSIREDDTEIINALQMVKGVVVVSPLIDHPGDFAIQARERERIRERIMELVHKELT